MRILVEESAFSFYSELESLNLGSTKDECAIQDVTDCFLRKLWRLTQLDEISKSQYAILLV